MEPAIVLENGVRAVFHRWTLLRLALDQGWANGDGKEQAEEMFASIMRLLLNDKKIYTDEIEDLLFDVLEKKFNTLAEDGSVEEVSALLLKIRNECAERNYETANDVILKAQATSAPISVSLDQSGNASDIDDDDDMEAPSLEPQPRTRAPEPIFDEDGFQIVTRTRSRR